jgi:hypothetical protein
MDQPNLDWTTVVAERRIKEAMDEGQFDNLPGKGEPLDLEPDPFTPVEMRIANKILKNARALPEWMQIEKDIEREAALVPAARERGLRSLAYCKHAPTRDRIAARLREAHRERIDLLNTLILKYRHVAPPSAQKPYPSYGMKREMAELDAAIAEAMASAGAAAKASDNAAPRRRRLW